jgi:hypothetical protein
MAQAAEVLGPDSLGGLDLDPESVTISFGVDIRA